VRVIRLLGARAASEAAQPRERSHQTKPGREAEGPGQRAAGAEGLYVTTLDPGNSPMALYAQRGRAPRVIDTMFSNKKTSTLHAGCRMQHKSSHHTWTLDMHPFFCPPQSSPSHRCAVQANDVRVRALFGAHAADLDACLAVAHGHGVSSA